MTLKTHFIVSSVVGLSFGFIFKSYVIGIASWLVGWIMDTDHLLDYFIYLKKFKKKFNLKEFFASHYLKKLGKIYFLAHGWEYLILFSIFGFWQLDNAFVFAVSFSYFLHLALDQYKYKVSPFIYFLIYRIKINFNIDKLCWE